MTRTQIIASAGGIAAFFAVVCNLATGADAEANRTLTIASVVAALISITCGAFIVRKETYWRYVAIALIGPGIFVLADAGTRMLLVFTR